MSLFQPKGNTVCLAVTAASARVALPSFSERDTLRIVNGGDNLAFFAFGDNAVAAVIPVANTPGNGQPIPAGHETGMTVPAGVTHIAAICPAGKTATLYITAGSGI